MSYIKTNWVNDETQVNAEHMNHIEEGIENSYNVNLIAVTDTAPSECTIGDKYYNTSDNRIYEATGTDTWGATGEEPLEDIFYIVLDEQTTYAYNGTTLVSVGGGSGSSDLVMVNEEPTEDTKLVIEESDLSFQGLDYVEDVYSTSEVKTNKVWVDGKPIYRKVIYISALPNKSAKSYSHNIKDIDTITFHCGFADNETGRATPLMFINPGAAVSTAYTSLGYEVDRDKINILNQLMDRSDYHAYVTLEYTKTTD